MNSTEQILNGYIEAAFWSTLDYTSIEDDSENMEHLDARYDFPDLDAETREQMARDCHEFAEEMSDAIETFVDAYGRDYDYVGHDLWLTRERHGAGFWDRGNSYEPGGNEARDALDSYAKNLGEFGDDLNNGLIEYQP